MNPPTTRFICINRCGFSLSAELLAESSIAFEMRSKGKARDSEPLTDSE